MKLPNSYGSVYKLSGKRRKPWAVRKTVGWKTIEDKQKAQPIYEFIGYYTTRTEALNALAAYNQNPYDISATTITFEELYERWSKVHFEKVSKSNITGVKASYKLCDKIKPMKIADIRLEHLQGIVDESGKNQPTLKKLKILWGLMYSYAVKYEIIPPEKREMVRYVDISQAGNPNKKTKKAFSAKEIETLWNLKDSNPYISIPLMLIYTGCRISEFLDLKKEDVHLEERWFYIRESKTDSGIREVPIAEKIVPFFEYWLKHDCEYLVCTPENERLEYRNYYDSYWKPFIENHTPHEARHTCVSLLTTVGVDQRIIKKIVGHKGQGVTEAVYTHLELPVKLEAINKI